MTTFDREGEEKLKRGPLIFTQLRRSLAVRAGGPRGSEGPSAVAATFTRPPDGAADSRGGSLTNRGRAKLTGRADEIERRCHKSSTPANDEPWPPQLTPSTLSSSSDGAPAGTGASVENERRRGGGTTVSERRLPFGL